MIKIVIKIVSENRNARDGTSSTPVRPISTLVILDLDIFRIAWHEVGKQEKDWDQ